ncbi:MAG: hypothetical protein K2G87_01575 [Oscillospiraceae bacterium]|nr:hypothetical protein [Oscillospiraceae bacterium]
MLKHVSIPYTQNGAALNLTAEQEENCRVLYKHVKDDLYEFAGLHDPEKNDADYPDGMLALPVRSVYGGVRYIPAGTGVWNVVRSSGDTWNGSSSANWIEIWETEMKNAGHPHTRKCYVAGSAGKMCNSDLYGGHMVDTPNTSPAPGSDGVVFIIPICNSHNNWHNTNQMTVSENVWALVLNRYHMIS